MSKKQRFFIDLSGVAPSCQAQLCLACNSEMSRNMNPGEDQPAKCEACLEEDTQNWYEQIALNASENDERLSEIEFDNEIRFTKHMLLSRSGRHAYMQEDIQDAYY